MPAIETVQVGKGGDLPIPIGLRKVAGIEEGSVVMIEARSGELLVRSVDTGIERYSNERKAEFLLSNAIDIADYRAACDEVRSLGLDPENISHHRPAGV